MQTDRIIFWQPLDSPHQDDFLEAVAAQFAGEVILGVERPFPAALAAQGWRTPRHRLVNLVDISCPQNHAMLAAHCGAESLHVFSGFFSHPLVWEGFRRLAATPARLAIYSEAPEQPLFTGWIKRLRGRLLAARWARRFAFVLAIGDVGRKFFASAGFSPETMVPFGYFVEPPPPAVRVPAVDGAAYRFISAGQLIRRKGVDLLIEACGTLPRTGWRLDVYGDGPERSVLERLAARRGLRDLIAFHGTIPHDDLVTELATADCVVLPSRFDGWGMLVGEALGSGTPAICTDRCGSADLLRACGSGHRVVAATVAGLSETLARALNDGPPTDDGRRRIRERAATEGSANGGAHRFLEAAGCVVALPVSVSSSTLTA